MWIIQYKNSTWKINIKLLDPNAALTALCASTSGPMTSVPSQLKKLFWTSKPGEVMDKKSPENYQNDSACTANKT